MQLTSDDTADHTVDAFHRGAFYVAQPARKGHRAGTDAMMLAASVPSSFAGHLIDLGSGAGAAGLGVASRCPRAHVTLLERSPEMVAYARRSIALAENAHIAARSAVVMADVRMPAKERRALVENASFDWAIMNPPFNSALDHATPDPLRREAHVMEDAGVFRDWLATAAALVRRGGGISVIARPHSLNHILEAMRPHFGRQEIKPLYPRIEKAAIRVVVRARRGGADEISLAPPLVLHEPGSNRLSQAADSISNGRASLFGD